MMNSFRNFAAADRRSRRAGLHCWPAIVVLAFALNAVAQAPAAPGGAAPPPSAEELCPARRPDRALSGRSGRDHPAGVDQSAAAGAGGSLSRQAEGRSQASHRRQVGRRGQVAAELSRRREDDERRPRLDERAGRGGRRRPGRRAGGDPELSPQGAGRGQPQVRRQAGRAGREGDHHHRPGRSAGDLRAAIQPDDVVVTGGRSMGLLPDAVPVVLLPVSARVPRSPPA